jgi:hypothetical protein
MTLIEFRSPDGALAKSGVGSFVTPAAQLSPDRRQNMAATED